MTFKDWLNIELNWENNYIQECNKLEKQLDRFVNCDIKHSKGE